MKETIIKISGEHQDEEAVKGLGNDGATIFQEIRQRQKLSRRNKT